MAQIVVYGVDAVLRKRVGALSDAIHSAAIEALGLPGDKRFHRFVPLERELFLAPPDRSDDYTIVEVSLFAGRSADVKKRFLRLLSERVSALGIAPADLEVTLTETPRENWLIRGLPADELTLPYRVALS
ncbi:ATP-dependent DNA helicase [Leifsonia xyli subsp. cynodontis DSM 46306]|jgi:hypothetical protein|uniref:Tautomerase family protein n=1 Tax=Leifsonia xyli subsp. cynodontis DSM 46306 TaxID=1389489 RepID=U3P626_LEIXC|nr:tautomerase family protein [Leifsonia xyli]AGW40889.1 ATP-dependent DNA helicase [Leifsonia xyli subsp. cynodontis DSM 46306]